MAVLKDLIVHGRSRFVNGIDADSIHANLIDANDGVFKTITTTTLDAETITTDMLTAQNARVAQTLTVDGTISTNKWEAANIANIGGNFYISPTGKANSGNITVTKTGSTTINGVSVGVYTLVVGNASFGVTSTSSTIWGTSSKVIFTGSIAYNSSKKYPLGTCNGTMTSVSTGSGTLTGFTITGVNSPALDIFFKEQGVTSVSSTACTGYEMQISVYQSYYSSALHPIGILLTSYGKDKKQYIDIYGGANTLGDSASGFANPSVRIGQLDGLSNIVDGSTDSTTAPSGWGIYTDNGFFKGKIVSNAGKIAGWTIGTSAIYNNTNSKTSTTAGTYLGTDAIRNYNSSTQYVHIESGKITAYGADIRGALTATSLSTGSKTSASSGTGTYIDSSGNIYSGSGSTNNFQVTSAGALTANSGTIGGWSFNNSYGLYTNSKTSTTSTNSGILIQKDGGIYAGAYSSSTEACPFQVTSAGALTATSGKIGGWTIGTNKMYSGTHSAWNSAVTDGVYLGNDGIAGGNGGVWYLWKDGSAKIGAMTLTAAGVLTVPAANISGELTAATISGSKITAGTIGTDQLAANAVTSAKIKAGEVKAGNIATDAVTADKIQAGAISIGKMDSTAQTSVNNGARVYNLQYATDTRNTNENPQYYITNYPREQVNEFKYTSVIGLSGSMYCTLTTIVPWNDSSGGYPKQEANVNGKRYWREGTSDTAWSAWVDAEAVATNYITRIDDAGITVHPSGGTSNRVAINADGMEIFKNDISVASYGDESRVGIANGYHTKMTDSSIELSNADNTMFQVMATGEIVNVKNTQMLLRAGKPSSGTSRSTTVILNPNVTYSFSMYASPAVGFAYSFTTSSASTTSQTATSNDSNFTLTVSYVRQYETVNGTSRIAHVKATVSETRKTTSLTYPTVGYAYTSNIDESSIHFFGTNNILWSGAYYMAATHTATLSESVSSQLNGIVLAWSYYNKTTKQAENHDWHYTFIPKQHVFATGGTGIACGAWCLDSHFNLVASKYVYVSNDEITGYENNDKSGTGTSGIKYDNTQFVLRYVLGV